MRAEKCLQVGPPSAALSAKPVEEWKAKEVANTVLQDRSIATHTCTAKAPCVRSP